MSLKNYIFSSINTKGAQDSEKFATIRLKSQKRKNMTIAENENGSATSGRTDSTATVPATVSTKAINETNADNEKFQCSWFFSGKGLLKILSYITVEPLMLCWLLPSCFLFIAVENLALEKVVSIEILVLFIYPHHEIYKERSIRLQNIITLVYKLRTQFEIM